MAEEALAGKTVRFVLYENDPTTGSRFVMDIIEVSLPDERKARRRRLMSRLGKLVDQMESDEFLESLSLEVM